MGDLATLLPISRATWVLVVTSVTTVAFALSAFACDRSGHKIVGPNCPALDKVMLGELIDLVSGIGMGEPSDKAKDILGRVYEYFLGGFAGSEGNRGGEFYTPRSVVRVLVEMLEPFKGRVYDPCCGSGGMFVQSEKFVRGIRLRGNVGLETTP